MCTSRPTVSCASPRPPRPVAALPHQPAGLTIQLLLFPESAQEGGPRKRRADPLPKLNVTDNIYGEATQQI